MPALTQALVKTEAIVLNAKKNNLAWGHVVCELNKLTDSICSELKNYAEKIYRGGAK